MENKSTGYSQTNDTSFTFKEIYFDFRKTLRNNFPRKLIMYFKIHPAHLSQCSHDYHFNIILAAFKKALNSRLPMCSLRTPGIILIQFTPSSSCLMLFNDLKSTDSIHAYFTGKATPFAIFFEKFKIKSEVFWIRITHIILQFATELNVSHIGQTKAGGLNRTTELLVW